MAYPQRRHETGLHRTMTSPALALRHSYWTCGPSGVHGQQRHRLGLSDPPPHTSANAAEMEFVISHPDYATTHVIDALRASEYSRLDAEGHTYLDYTGAALYGVSQINAHMDVLRRIVVGNPHSGNVPSRTMTLIIERARKRVLDYLRASPDDYVVIFTPNATGALK